MEHIAMLLNGDDPAATTSWQEHITDDQYKGNQGSRTRGTGAAPEGLARPIHKSNA